MSAKSCKHCGKQFLSKRKEQKYCSVECCRVASRTRVVATCARKACGKQFETVPNKIKRGRAFCSRECSYPEKSVCQNPDCGKSFRPYHRGSNPWKGVGKYCSRECYHDHRWGKDRPRRKRSMSQRRNASDSAIATSLRKRCKSFGVTFDPACTRRAILERDRLVCQSCGVKCNKEYLLDPVTRVPDSKNAEHDHIIPLSVPGSPGNVFENSQCLCRNCNSRKSNKSEGQLRLCLEERAWGKGVRVRSQHSSKSCVAIQGSAV